MNVKRLRAQRDLLIKAAVRKQNLEVPEWRFDGKAVTTAQEVAVLLAIPEVEAVELLAQKDVHGMSGAGVIARGVGTRTAHQGISQRANALAYGKRRRRRHKRRTEK